MSDETDAARTNPEAGAATPEGPSTNTDDQKSARTVSTIRFPYSDLGEVERLAISMHEKRGRETNVGTLAADVGADNTSFFRSKVSAGVVFGVFETLRGEGALRLTELGVRLADPDLRDEARAEAFLNVPLYRSVVEHFHGSRLPGDQGIESEMQRMGVAPKQVGRARQTMVRSAEHAGFFGSGRDRLVEPPLRARGNGSVSDDRQGGGHAEEPLPPPPPAPTMAVMNHPLIVGLLQVLPDPGEPMTEQTRTQWIETLTANMKFIWPEPAVSKTEGQSSAATSNRN